MYTLYVTEFDQVLHSRGSERLTKGLLINFLNRYNIKPIEVVYEDKKTRFVGYLREDLPGRDSISNLVYQLYDICIKIDVPDDYESRVDKLPEELEGYFENIKVYLLARRRQEKRLLNITIQ